MKWGAGRAVMTPFKHECHHRLVHNLQRKFVDKNASKIAENGTSWSLSDVVNFIKQFLDFLENEFEN